ncbi:MAG: RNA polymerase sigma factor [Kofleriaceae bacterium]
MTRASGPSAPLPPVAGGELDELTLIRARRGDPSASRALFDHYKDLVFRYLWRMFGPRSTVAAIEDLTQDTFLRAFEALDRFSAAGPARLSTWLLTIATRVGLNEVRRQRRRGAGATVEIDHDLLRSTARADEAAERRALGARIADALQDLPPEHRAVFILREYHDLSYQEIASVLEIELGTVQSRLSRARAALRAALEDIR